MCCCASLQYCTPPPLYSTSAQRMATCKSWHTRPQTFTCACAHTTPRRLLLPKLRLAAAAAQALQAATATELSELRTQLASSHHDVAQLRRHLEAAEETAALLPGAREEARGLRDDVRGAALRIEALEERCTALQTEREELVAAGSVSNARLAEMEAALGAAQEEAASRGAALEVARTDARELQLRLAHASAASAAAAEAAAGELSGRDRELALSRGAVARAQREVAAQEAEIASLRAQVACLTAEFADKEARLAALVAGLEHGHLACGSDGIDNAAAFHSVGEGTEDEEDGWDVDGNVRRAAGGSCSPTATRRWRVGVGGTAVDSDQGAVTQQQQRLVRGRSHTAATKGAATTASSVRKGQRRQSAQQVTRGSRGGTITDYLAAALGGSNCALGLLSTSPDEIADNSG